MENDEIYDKEEITESKMIKNGLDKMLNKKIRGEDVINRILY